MPPLSLILCYGLFVTMLSSMDNWKLSGHQGTSAIGNKISMIVWGVSTLFFYLFPVFYGYQYGWLQGIGLFISAFVANQIIRRLLIQQLKIKAGWFYFSSIFLLPVLMVMNVYLLL